MPYPMSCTLQRVSKCLLCEHMVEASLKENDSGYGTQNGLEPQGLEPGLDLRWGCSY